jgi:glutathione S-transferase
MPLQLFYHPLSSYCHKALIALYENDIPFERRILSQDDPATGAEFGRLWKFGKMPLLQDVERNRAVAESSIIIEYLQQFHPGKTTLIPTDPTQSVEVRLWDRMFDLYVHNSMQKIVGDSFRPSDGKDCIGVEEARTQLRKMYDIVEATLGKRSWIVGDTFTMADCAAAPALFYADTVEPIGSSTPHTLAYLNRLMSRPSYARILEEAKPYFGMFPLDPKPSRAQRKFQRA